MPKQVFNKFVICGWAKTNLRCQRIKAINLREKMANGRRSGWRKKWPQAHRFSIPSTRRLTWAMAGGHDLDLDLGSDTYKNKQEEMGKRRQCQIKVDGWAWPGGMHHDSIHFCNCFARKMRVKRQQQLNCLPGQTAIKNASRKNRNLMFVCVSIQCLFVCRKAVAAIVVVVLVTRAGHWFKRLFYLISN